MRSHRKARPESEQVSRNGNEPHRMSSESANTGEPSRSAHGEGCQGRAGQSRKDVGPTSLMSDQRTGGVGGVGGGGGSGRVGGLSDETCHGGAAVAAPTSGTSAATREAGRAEAGVGDLHSSVDPAERTTDGERREGTCPPASQSGKGPDDGWSDELWIKTSPKVRKLQRVLYRKAKAEPRWRFYSLYGELFRQDLLSDALDQVIANGGAPGVDGFEVGTLAKESAVRAAWLLALAEELRTKRYRPSPVRRVYIWKDQAKTKRRALGIPTVKDRVVQSAAAIVLQPIWEADFHDHSYAYRPKRRTHQAMDKVKEALLSGKVEVVDADLSSYFDLIPHAQLLRRLAQRVSDGSMLRLIKAWLRAPIVEEDRDSGRRRVIPNRRGTPQGGVISPWTHLVTSSFPPDCLWCEGTGICGLDVMTHRALFMRPIESILRGPALPTCEPSPAIRAARTSSGGGGATARAGARDLHPPGASLCRACPKNAGAEAHSGRKSGVYGEAAAPIDPAGAPDRATAGRRDRRLGRRRVAAGAARRFRPWVTHRPRRDSTCGSKPSEIVWRRKKWPAPIACSCHHRCALLPKN